MYRSIATIHLFILFSLFANYAFSQTAILSGQLSSTVEAGLSFATVAIEGTSFGTSSDENGFYRLEGIPAGSYTVLVTYIGHQPVRSEVILQAGEERVLDIELLAVSTTIDEVVVTGTLKQMSRLESPVPVEVYAPSFFRKNPTPNIYEAPSKH